GYLTDRGTLFYNGRTPEESFLSRFPFKGGIVLETDWNGRVLREVRHVDHHHGPARSFGSGAPGSILTRWWTGSPRSRHLGRSGSKATVSRSCLMAISSQVTGRPRRLFESHAKPEASPGRSVHLRWLANMRQPAAERQCPNI